MELIGFYNSFQAAQEAVISKLLSTVVIQVVNAVADKRFWKQGAVPLLIQMQMTQSTILSQYCYD